MIFALLLISNYAPAQAPQTRGVQPVQKTEAGNHTGITYAVVVGISEYDDDQITDLKYAHVDATAFAQFLRSPAGGSVPDENITFLINENATAGKVAAAMDGLVEQCKEGDRALIYFSGHGDVESKMITQPGFLLCKDAPPKVYMGGGTYPLMYLQLIISTLTQQNKADVVLFADACHIGKLAGTGIGGPVVTATNLSQVSAGEVKVLSCQPEELSLEGIDWGGGRGLFSYYLVNGLTGLADRNSDGIVTVLEIERYLEDEVPNAAKPHVQMPLVLENGKKTMPLAWVDSLTLVDLKKSLELNREPTLAAIDSRDMEEAVLAGRDSSALFQFRQFKKAIKEGRLLEPEDQCAYAAYQILKDRPVMKPFRGMMQRNLAAAFQDEAQIAINDYLSADPVEMRKRWTFDTHHYEQFPVYLEKAAEILGTDHYMHNVLKARENYFRGLNLRLRGEQKKDPDNFRTAIELQNKALKWDENAAYAYNELGLLERRLGNLKEAEHYFEKAIAISPQWVLPWTNLNAIYNDLNEFELGITCGQQAEKIDPDFPLAHFNLAVSFYGSDQLENAKKQYHKALALDPNFADACFNLGLISYFDGNYQESERLWKKYSELIPTDPSIFQNLAAAYKELGKEDERLAALEHAIEIDPKYYNAQFDLVEYYVDHKNYTEAEKELKKYQINQPKDPRSPYMLARIQLEQQKPAEALKYLEKAFDMGFQDKGYLDQDVHMEALRNLPEYEDLIARFFPKN